VEEQDFVICGWLSGERDYFGSLLLGAFKDSKLVYTGNVGSGFTGKLIAEVYVRSNR
jgi:bifunctional non-homologous end joining protein LigD